MPFEFIADYNTSQAGLGPNDVKWGRVATALTVKLLALESRLRVVLRGLPPPGKAKHLVFQIKPEVAKTLAEPLQTRCQIPEGRWELLHQYFCKGPGCLRANGDKRWFPKMYLPLHQGPDHEIERTAPTGRSQKFPWQPTMRLFFGAPARLVGSVPVMASGCVTGVPSAAELQGLTRFDWMFLAGANGPDVIVDAQNLGIKAEHLLSANPAETLLTWMKQQDPKLLEPLPGEALDEGIETVDADAAAAAIRKRLAFAQGMIDAKVGARLEGAVKRPGLIE